MPNYTVTDPQTGQSATLTGDSPPTEQELNDIFSKLPKGVNPETGDVAEPSEGIVKDLTRPFRHPIETIKKHGLEYAGAGAGAASAMAGAAPLALASGPLAPFVEGAAAVGGAYIGGAAGKATQSTMEAAGNVIRPGTNPKRTPGQVVEGVAQAGKGMAEAEAIGRPVGELAGKVIQKTWGAIKPAVSKAISETTARGIRAAQEMGIPLTYGQLSQSKVFLGLEGFMRTSPLFGDLIATKDLEARKALEAARAGLLYKLGPKTTTESLGTAAKQEMDIALTKAETSRLQRYGLDKENAASGFPAPQLPEARRVGMEQASSQAKNKALAQRARLYEAADQAHDPMAMVDNSQRKKEGEAIVEEYGKEGAKNLRGPVYTTANSYANPSLPESVRKVPQAVIDYVKENPNLEIPKGSGPNGSLTIREAPQAQLYAQAKQLSPEQIRAITNQGRMNVVQLQNEINMLGDQAEKNRIFPGGDYSASGRQYLRMKNAAQSDLDAHFASASPEAKRLYALADTFHGAYSETYRNSTLKKIWGENPKATFMSVAQDGSDVEIKRLARSLNGVAYPGRTDVSQNGVNILKRQLFDQVFSESKTGIPTEAEALKGLSKYGAAVRALFSEQDQSALRRFALKGESPSFLQSEYDVAAKGLIKGSPQDLVKEVLGGNVMLARAAKKYLPSKTWEAMGRQLAENITTAVPGPSVEQGFSGIRKRVENYEPEYLREFFPENVVQGMMRIGDASQILPGYGDLAQKPASAAGSGSRATMMMAGMFMYHFGSPKLAALVISGPMIAKLYTSEMGQRFLTTLMRMPQDDPRIVKLVGQSLQFWPAPPFPRNGRR